MTDIKLKKQRYADKENLKKLMRYSKNTFANKNEINEKFYTKEQIDTKLEGISGGTGGGGSTGGGTCSDCYTKSEIDTKLNSKVNTSDLSNYYTKPEVDNLLSKYYTKKQIDILLRKVIVNQQVLGGAIYNPDIDEYNNETEHTMKTVSAVVEPTSVNAYTIVENSDTVEEL